MFELSVGYVVGMITGYIVWKSSAEETVRDLKRYLEEFKESVL